MAGVMGWRTKAVEGEGVGEEEEEEEEGEGEGGEDFIDFFAHPFCYLMFSY